MKIEVWSDYVCPFCYVGKRRLEEAIAETGLQDHVEISFKAFQLDPNWPADSTVSTYDSLATKYGVSVEEAKRMTEGIAVQAKTVGLNYDFDKIIPTNTLDAHRLAKLAEEFKLEAAMTERLLKAHFINGERIGDKDVLANLAEEVGIPRSRAEEVLASNELADAVNGDIREANQIGVQGVPFFVINRKYAISGAQPTETFSNALRKVAEEEGVQPALQVLGGTDGVCKDGSCDM